MLEEEMTVGPKGQVVIPRAMRKVLKIQPGSKVVFRLEDGRAILEKQEFDAVSQVFGVESSCLKPFDARGCASDPSACINAHRRFPACSTV